MKNTMNKSIINMNPYIKSQSHHIQNSTSLDVIPMVIQILQYRAFKSKFRMVTL